MSRFTACSLQRILYSSQSSGKSVDYLTLKNLRQALCFASAFRKNRSTASCKGWCPHLGNPPCAHSLPSFCIPWAACFPAPPSCVYFSWGASLPTALVPPQLSPPLDPPLDLFTRVCPHWAGPHDLSIWSWWSDHLPLLTPILLLIMVRQWRLDLESKLRKGVKTFKSMFFPPSTSNHSKLFQ